MANNSKSVLNKQNTGIGIFTTGSTFVLQISGSIGPDINGVFDLGSSTFTFRNLYGTSSFATSASFAVNAAGSIPSGSTQNITSSWATTSSYAITASYISGSIVGTVLSSSYALTSSLALTMPPNSVRTISGSYSIQLSDFVILCNATASITVTLPTAANVQNQIFHVKKIDSSGSVVTITGSIAGQVIDGQGSKTINTQWTNMQVISNGSNWYVL